MMAHDQSQHLTSAHDKLAGLWPTERIRATSSSSPLERVVPRNFEQFYGWCPSWPQSTVCRLLPPVAGYYGPTAASLNLYTLAHPLILIQCIAHPLFLYSQKTTSLYTPKMLCNVNMNILHTIYQRRNGIRPTETCFTPYSYFGQPKLETVQPAHMSGKQAHRL